MKNWENRTDLASDGHHPEHRDARRHADGRREGDAARTTSTCWSIRRRRFRRRRLALPNQPVVNDRPIGPLSDERQRRHSGNHRSCRLQPHGLRSALRADAGADRLRSGGQRGSSGDGRRRRCRSGFRSGRARATKRASCAWPRPTNARPRTGGPPAAFGPVPRSGSIRAQP